jgi:hypothetical protein
VAKGRRVTDETVELVRLHYRSLLNADKVYRAVGAELGVSRAGVERWCADLTERRKPWPPEVHVALDLADLYDPVPWAALARRVRMHPAALRGLWERRRVGLPIGVRRNRGQAGGRVVDW